MVLKMSPNKNIERWSRTRFWKIKDWSKHTRRKRSMNAGLALHDTGPYRWLKPKIVIIHYRPETDSRRPPAVAVNSCVRRFPGTLIGECRTATGCPVALEMRRIFQCILKTYSAVKN